MRLDSMLMAAALAAGLGVAGTSSGAGQAGASDVCDAVSPDESSHGVSGVAGAAQVPAILDHLVGAWEGEGALFGRPASFAMTWARELDGRFLGISYEIRGDVRMSAQAHYRLVDAPALEGVWVDSRGEILELEATARDSSLTTVWRSDTETGRTVYRRADGDSLEVCDYVQVGDGWRLFGSALYVRR